MICSITELREHLARAGMRVVDVEMGRRARSTQMTREQALADEAAARAEELEP